MASTLARIFVASFRTAFRPGLARRLSTIKRPGGPNGSQTHIIPSLSPRQATAQIKTLCSTGDYTSADELLRTLKFPSAFEFNLVLGAHAKSSSHGAFTALLKYMVEKNVPIDKFTILAVCKLASASPSGAEDLVVQLPSLVATAKCEHDSKVTFALFDVYAKQKMASDAFRVFSLIPPADRTPLLWTSLINAHSFDSKTARSVPKIVEDMLSSGVAVDHVTILAMMRAASMAKDNEFGELTLKLAEKAGCSFHVKVMTAAVDMLGKTVGAGRALQYFNEIPSGQRSISVWNSLILSQTSDNTSSARIPSLVKDLLTSNILPDQTTAHAIIRAASTSANLSLGQVGWDIARRLKLDKNIRVLNAMIDMFGKCGKPDVAVQVFDDIPPTQRDLVSWNSVLLATEASADLFLHLLSQMKATGIESDSVTAFIMMRAAISQSDVKLGEDAFNRAVQLGCSPDSRVVHSMVHLYVKCGHPEKALATFRQNSDALRDVYAWSALMMAHCYRPLDAVKVRELFAEMIAEKIEVNPAIVMILLRAAAVAVDIVLGKDAVQRGITLGCMSDTRFLAAVLDMYGKCAEPELALQFFEEIPTPLRTVHCWSALINAHSHTAAYAALVPQFIDQMQKSGVKADRVSVLSILGAAAKTASAALGEMALAMAADLGCSSDEKIVCAAIDMYGRCGKSVNAQTQFDSLRRPSSIAYASLISAYGVNGEGKQALRIYQEAQHHGIDVTEAMAVSLLQGLSHSLMIDDALQQYGCLAEPLRNSPRVIVTYIDCLCRVGRIDEALVVADRVPESDIALLTILGACRLQVDVRKAESVFERLIKVNPECVPAYILLANTYGLAKMFDKRDEVMDRMRKLSLFKIPGISTAVIGDKLHNFYANHTDHPMQVQIEEKLVEMAERLRKIGHTPDTAWVTRKFSSKQLEEQALCKHSERQALAFSLLMLPQGADVTIVKNLRVCGDCHEATKLFSVIYGCKIHLRDTSRFHHFDNGKCSCGDKW